jgi:transcriptional regulator with XRE-family HTH domain
MESISTGGLNEALTSVLGSLNLDGGSINLDKFKRDFAAKCFKEYNPLRQWRKRHEMTITEVAETSGLSKITVGNYESGWPQAGSPSLPNLFLMFEAVSPCIEASMDMWISEQVGSYALWYRASTGDEENMAEYIQRHSTGVSEEGEEAK